MTILTLKAVDEGTYIIDYSFADEDGAAVTPDTMNWTMRSGGVVINSREDVEITPLSTSGSLVLSGDDLDRADGTDRFVLFSGTYTSSLGSDLPLRAQCKFIIEPLIALNDPA